MMTMKHVLLILTALLFFMTATVFLMLDEHRDKTHNQQAQAKPTPIWNAPLGTPGPDPDIQELLRHTPPIK
jgi:hypothetical protein